MDPIAAVLSILACLAALACLCVGFLLQHRQRPRREAEPPDGQSATQRRMDYLRVMGADFTAAYRDRRWSPSPPALCVCGAPILRSRVKPGPVAPVKELARCSARCGAVWAEVGPRVWAVTHPGDYL